jgi:hypothetical protein
VATIIASDIGAVAGAAKALVDQSGLWLLPAIPIVLLMVLAMMECTRTLLVKPAPKGLKPVEADALRRRLIALSSQQDRYQVVEGKPWDLEFVWDVVPASWQKHPARIKCTTIYRARMLLDESRHELRWFEYTRTSGFFMGFDGWRPVLSWSLWFQIGYVDVVWSGVAYEVLPGFPPRIGRVHRFSVNTVAAKQDVRKIVGQSGWSFQPRLWWFQVRRSPGGQVPGALLGPVFRQVTERRFWGVAYPGLYALFCVYMIAINGGWSNLTAQSLLPIVLVSVLWWGIWGAITTVLLRLSAPRRARGE